MRTATRGGLWNHRDFRRLWIGDTVSQFGTSVSRLALPLLALLVLHASTFEVGLLTAFETLAFLLIGLPVEAWVDRMRCRRSWRSATWSAASRSACYRWLTPSVCSASVSSLPSPSSRVSAPFFSTSAAYWAAHSGRVSACARRYSPPRLPRYWHWCQRLRPPATPAGATHRPIAPGGQATGKVIRAGGPAAGR